jgi:hypothetical protein
MKRFINIIAKSARIKSRFMKIVGTKFNPNRHNRPNIHNHQIDLDNHNDSSNWTYN